MLIAIDAGHGIYTPGKRCLKSIDPMETREWVLNSRIADKLQLRLKQFDCQTMRVDDINGETDVDNYLRTKRANEAGADVYLSIHHNAGIGGGSGGGIVVYRHTSAEDTSPSAALQRAVYSATVETTGLRGNRASPMARANFQVLRQARMTAVLGEFGFMDSTTDTPIILTEEFADQVADGLTRALVETYDLEEVEQVTYEQWKAYMDRYRAELAQQPPSDWAKVKLALARAAGITADGSRPRDLVTREEAALMSLAAANVPR